jgi:tetratricopeptide (TPR) repeat protein
MGNPIGMAELVRRRVGQSGAEESLHSLLALSGKRSLTATAGAAALLLLAACPGGTQQTTAPRVAEVSNVTGNGESTGAMPSFSSASGDYLAARQAQEDGDTDTAARLMAEALDHDPNNAEILRQTFHLMLIDGQIDKARTLAERVAAVMPDNQIAQLILIIEGAKSGRWKDAETRIEKLNETGLASLVNPLIQAWLQQGEGKTDDAIKTLSQLSSSRGFAVLGDYHTALIEDFAGRNTEAEAAYQRALNAEQSPSLRVVEPFAAFYVRTGRPQLASKLYEGFLADNPETVRIAITLKRIKAGEKLPRMVKSPKDGLAEAIFDVGSALRQDTGTEVAVQFMRLALVIDPQLTVAKMMLANMVETDRPQEAIALYRSVQRDSLFYFSAQLRVADVLRTDDKMKEAIAVLEALAAAWPDRSEPLATEGDFLRATDKFADAVKAYDRAVARIGALKPDDWSLLYARGVALERDNNWPRAEKDFLDALKLSPDQPNVLNYLGYSWVDRGQNLDRAQNMIERAVTLRPNDGYIVDSLGWVLYREGHYDTAVTNLEHAVELKPDDPVINDHLGDAYWRVGRLSEARYQWHRALSLKPEPDLVTTIGQKLEHGLKAVKVGEQHT